MRWVFGYLALGAVLGLLVVLVDEGDADDALEAVTMGALFGVPFTLWIAYEFAKKCWRTRRAATGGET